MLNERKLIIVGLAVLALLGGLAVIIAMAVVDDTQTLTISIVGVNDILLGDAAVSVSIAAIDTEYAETTTVTYATNAAQAQKITAELDSAYSSGIVLTVAASGSEGGGTNGSGTLSTGGTATAVDVITAISQTSGQRTITYTATADATVGAGTSEEKTVTFTLAQQ